VDARSAPGCVRRPRVPFVVAANGPRSIRLVARFGQGWVTSGPRTEDDNEWWAGVAERARRLDDELARVERPRHTVSRYLSLDSSPTYSLSSVACFTDLLGKATQLGFTDVLSHWPRADGVFAGHESVVEEIAADVLPGLPGHSKTT
jgi:alkanesulfonate monooxygenase SsuD/methylene tetrahydromethanopterin reductase-like flavin-dependent oxidoreductase (luciferase family)